jgi:hypothetical protein
MVEARLLFEELSSTILMQFFPFLKCVYFLRKEKIVILNSSNDNRASAMFFDCPACHMVTLAFNWLMSSFKRTSYYTLLP